MSKSEKTMLEQNMKLKLTKTKWHLLDTEFIKDIAEVLTFGANKYSEDNWKNIDDAYNVYYDALMRHITEWKLNGALDEDDNKSHLVHAACNLMFLYYFDKETEDVGSKQLECERKTNKRRGTKKRRK